MWSLNSYQQTWIILPFRVLISRLMKSQLFEIIMSYVSILCIVRIVPNFLLLFIKNFNQTVQLTLFFLQLVFFRFNLRVLFAERIANKINWVRKFFKRASHTFFGTAFHIIHSVRIRSLSTIYCSWTIPTNIIFTLFCNQTNTFQYICNVVNSTFLYFQKFHRVIKIKCLVRSLLEQINKFFGQLNKPIFLASTPVLTPWTIIVISIWLLMHTERSRNSTSK